MQDKGKELIEKVYRINIDACEQEKAIALKYNDSEMLARVNKSLAYWQAKLEALQH